MNIKASLQILTYLIISIIVIIIIKYEDSRYLNGPNNKIINIKNNKDYRKISIYSIVFISILMGLYSVYVTKYPFSLDRANYALRFIDYWDNPWTPGLNMISNLLHIFTNDPYALFFSISFIYTFVSLFAYRLYKDAGMITIFLLLISNYFIYSYYLFKQAPAVAFATLSFAAFFSKRKLLCILSLIIAITFHESALIMLPLYLILIKSDKVSIRILQYLVAILCVILYGPIASSLTNLSQTFMPSLYNEIKGYLDVQGIIQDNEGNLQTIIKGFPYYWITVCALFLKSTLRRNNVFYYQYLSISLFISLMYILSFKMYWMFRFSLYGLPLVFILAESIVKNSKTQVDRLIFLTPLVSSLFLLTYRYLYQIIFINGGF